MKSKCVSVERLFGPLNKPRNTLMTNQVDEWTNGVDEPLRRVHRIDQSQLTEIISNNFFELTWPARWQHPSRNEPVNKHNLRLMVNCYFSKLFFPPKINWQQIGNKILWPSEFLAEAARQPIRKTARLKCHWLRPTVQRPGQSFIRSPWGGAGAAALQRHLWTTAGTAYQEQAAKLNLRVLKRTHFLKMTLEIIFVIF